MAITKARKDVLVEEVIEEIKYASYTWDSKDSPDAHSRKVKGYYKKMARLTKKLAKLGTDEAIEYIINIVEGGFRRKKYMFFKEFYGEDDQLIAIKSLYYANNEKALEYLEHIYKPKLVQNDWVEDVMEGYPWDLQSLNHVYHNTKEVDYPNAPKTIRNDLGYAFDSPSDELSYKVEDKRKKVLEDRIERSKGHSNVELHIIIPAAIKNLEVKFRD